MGIDPLTRRRAVFLDRDGVLNKALVRDGKPYPPGTLAELEVPGGTAAALERLRAAGFLLLVVTNQPDVARGTQTAGAIEEIHAALRAALPVDEFLVCPHDDADGCECRKPKPGLLFEGAARHGVELRGSYMVGDRWRDVEAGQRAGCRTVFIDYGYAERKPSPPADATVPSLTAAADWILKERWCDIS